MKSIARRFAPEILVAMFLATMILIYAFDLSWGWMAITGAGTLWYAIDEVRGFLRVLELSERRTRQRYRAEFDTDYESTQ